MHDYEKLGVFYLGRRYDPSCRQTTTEPLLYESRHLVTHGLVVGMTGSGKTGLCCALIEEAAIDGIPAIVIDPKGDLGSLLLTFPELRPADFAPWVNEEDARRQGLAPADFAVRQADRWRQGLQAWDQSPARIQRLRDAAEFAIYTPASSAGWPLSVLSSFAAPPMEVMEDAEALRDRVQSTVAGLLGLVGLDADPVRSREAILLAQLLQQAWTARQPLELAGLIQGVQTPPMARVGVLDLETFYPAKERFELAMQLNHLLAAPGFAAWLQGEPLNVSRLLYSPQGRPRVAIVSIAHLSEAERMFFVTLLLNEVLAWMRTQSGTSSLRALVYMDEIFGYFPPVANPPSKRPLLTLLKQARAFGIGVVLATQNPLDLDYKGLANIGTWCIGRLQTERDQARILEGLQGATAADGGEFDRAEVESLLASLEPRVFLLRDVQAEGLALFESRWALSYLRGPLSRTQIKTLMDSRRGVPAPAAVPAEAAVVSPAPAPAPATRGPARADRPVLPPEVPQFFLPPKSPLPSGGRLLYRPRLLGAAQVRFTDAKNQVDVSQDMVVVTEIVDRAVPVDWAAAEEMKISLDELQAAPGDGEFAPCAAAASQARNYAAWAKDFTVWIQQQRSLRLLQSPSLRLTSRPGEEEREFRIRLQQSVREERDATAEALRRKYAPKLATLQERLRRAEAAQEREAGQARRAQFDTLVSVGSTLLGAFLGRRAISSTTVGRAATSMRSAGRALDQAGDVTRARETIEALRGQLAELEAEFNAETAAVAQAPDPAAETLVPLEIRPSRPNINVRLVALVWIGATP
jgi:hypothetical protein